MVDVTGQNREVITGSDFKRMLSGAYSEFLLDYEDLNGLRGMGQLPGTHILHTIGAAIMSLYEVKDDSIGGLARRAATGAVFGARGSAGVVLAQMFRGLGKGLIGKQDATSSEFGKAFQYGILYAQRVIPDQPQNPFIMNARAVAKGAYHAVRDNEPITEILQAALASGKEAMAGIDEKEAGPRIMSAFLEGCLKGLDGNFVSPAVSLSLGLNAQQPGMPNPAKDRVRAYCVRMLIRNPKLNVPKLEKQLHQFSSFALVEREERYISVHIHTDHVGQLMELAVGWGPLRDVHITNMSESHALGVHDALMPVGLLAVAENKVQAKEMEDDGINIIVPGSEQAGPSVAELVNAAHSDLAESYVMVAWSPEFWLVFRQAKRLLGSRVELVLCANKNQQAAACKAFDLQKTAAENAHDMTIAAGLKK